MQQTFFINLFKSQKESQTDIWSQNKEDPLQTGFSSALKIHLKIGLLRASDLKVRSRVARPAKHNYNWVEVVSQETRCCLLWWCWKGCWRKQQLFFILPLCANFSLSLLLLRVLLNPCPIQSYCVILYFLKNSLTSLVNKKMNNSCFCNNIVAKRSLHITFSVRRFVC